MTTLICSTSEFLGLAGSRSLLSGSPCSISMGYDVSTPQFKEWFETQKAQQQQQQQQPQQPQDPQPGPPSEAPPPPPA
jgi:hypothetical protein